jgi:hypothetical protein
MVVSVVVVVDSVMRKTNVPVNQDAIVKGLVV